jgi:hypothetical protein
VNRTEMAAVTLYPELIRIIEMRQSGGWVFQPVVVDTAVELLAGWRVWLLGGWSDAVTIRSQTDAKAFRCNADGGTVWKLEGTLNDVVDGLIDLPTPDAPHAPKLVLGRRPTLWIPGTAL